MPKACAVLDGPEVSMTVLGDEVDTGVSAPSARPVLPQPHAAKVVPVDRVVRQELPADALKLPAPPNRVGVKSAQKITERSRGQPFTRAARRSSATISATSDIRTAISVPARQLPGGQVWRPGGYRGRRGFSWCALPLTGGPTSLPLPLPGPSAFPQRPPCQLGSGQTKSQATCVTNGSRLAGRDARASR
jgi:hypothetical protein